MGLATLPLTTAPARRPLFRGYALIAFVGAWLVGDWLSGLGALSPVAPLAWLGVAGVGLATSGGAALTAGRPLSRLGAWRIMRTSLVLGALLFWVGLGAARAAWTDPLRDPTNIVRFASGAQAQVTGQVIDQPDERDGYRLLTVQASAVRVAGALAPAPATGYVEATVYGPNDWFSPAYGDSVTLTGSLKPVSGGGAPTSVTARMSSARASITARGGGWAPLAALFQLRVALAQAIERTLPEPEAALLIGILLGLKSPALRARLPLFVNTGTIHLVVPAGLKVSLLAEFASRAARRLGVWPRSVAALLAVGVYAALGGGGPASIRAAIMGALLALAPALGRVYNVYTALALATLIMTLIDPALLYDAGFQLTVLATFALPLLTPALQQALLRPLGRLARLGVAQTVTESFAVTLAAQVATLPTLALTFHVVSLVAPLANLLTVPLLAPLLALGGLLALVATLGWSLLALALAWVVWPLLWWVNAAIAGCAALPLAALQAPPAPAPLAAVYYAALVAVILALAPRLAAASRALRDDHHDHRDHRRARHPLVGRALAITVGLALLGSLGASAPALAAQRRAQLTALDVGSGGSALLLRLPSGATVLIDGGPSGPALESALAGRMPFWQRTLDVVALTDVRPGDARGLEDAATHFTITHALDAGTPHPGPEYLAYLDAMRRAGATRQEFRAGDTLRLDATTTLTSLAPPQTLYPPNEGDTTASDDSILRLETPGLRALLLGAADAYALDALAGYGEPLTADVVVVAVPRGAPLDLSGPLGDVLRLAHPHAIIVTDAPVASRVHKGATLTANMWASDADVTAATGAQVYRVSDTGTLTLSGDARSWSLG
ncbi:MAG TPA: ComEC/Rec2 family competence protein [Ktedonobacterales bacterium]|jgi:competence protein ComEC|nr:ComEC/Rec2 family competence protein [Ktedonobacterales bacterium]